MPILFLFWFVIIFLLFKLTRQYHRGEINTQEFFAWFLFWIFAGVASFFVRALDPLAKYFGVSRAIDLGVYIAVAILFYVVYRILLRLERIEKNITLLVRNRALKNESDEKSRDHYPRV